ncbi:VOC family protein [Streptomyces sp. SID13726]|uniref:VOC family protein n=1 Tax=Streptomyces sp. SID13726 TaxID=2706058 RepID=UPI0013B5F68C|nr:VOC family protein [Streptomyces sp. SID13726]NEB03904.1 VOC family protein [Streptomyces sp. SID13726]
MAAVRVSTVVLDARDAHELARFYRRLLGYVVRSEEPEWVLIGPPAGVEGVALALQGEPEYVPPTWPSRDPGEQQMMLHLDIEVDDLDAETARAVAEGARAAEYQPQDDVRVLFDPAGHPFCLWTEVREGQ